MLLVSFYSTLRISECIAKYSIISMNPRLFFLNASTSSSFSLLNTLLVALDLSARHSKRAVSLPGPLEIADRRLVEEVNLNEISLKSALERDDRLDEKRIGVFEIEVHESHHGQTHQLRLPLAAELVQVVVVDRGRNELAFLGGSHGRRLDVLERRHVCDKIRLEKFWLMAK